MNNFKDKIYRYKAKILKMMKKEKNYFFKINKKLKKRNKKFFNKNYKINYDLIIYY